MKKSLLIFLFTICSLLTTSAQWQPTAEWPFLYRDFTTATITTTTGKVLKAKADIHIGHHALWYESAGRRLQAKDGTVARAVFPDGSVFYNVNNMMCQVVREDSVGNDVKRLYRLVDIDKEKFDEMQRSANGGLLEGMGTMLNNLSIDVAVNNSVEGMDVDQRPLPQKTKYYILSSGNSFEATTTYILKNIPKSRKKEYLSYTRSAEVITGQEQSMINVYQEFFLK